MRGWFLWYLIKFGEFGDKSVGWGQHWKNDDPKWCNVILVIYANHVTWNGPITITYFRRWYGSINLNDATPTTERYELALTVFAAWCISISLTQGVLSQADRLIATVSESLNGCWTQLFGDQNTLWHLVKSVI